ncbi:MAG: sulfite exporter TauE/SafE family protein [Planctomycetaceae bacterium]
MTGELVMIFVAGLLGSSHCVGMCGGFAMLVGLNSPARWRGLERQCVYSVGRIFTYVMLGGVAGLLGHRLTTFGLTNQILRVAAGLCVIAGLFLVYEGLKSAGFLLGRRTVSGKSCGGCLSSSVLQHFLQGPKLHSAFLGGILTGYLPCGLVYAFLALAAARMNPVEGMAVMGAFGLGTVPLMVLAGVGSTFLTVSGRQRLLRAAAWCVVLTGVLTVVRGASFLQADVDPSRGACPFCTTPSR